MMLKQKWFEPLFETYRTVSKSPLHKKNLNQIVSRVLADIDPSNGHHSVIGNTSYRL